MKKKRGTFRCYRSNAKSDTSSNNMAPMPVKPDSEDESLGASALME